MTQSHEPHLDLLPSDLRIAVVGALEEATGHLIGGERVQSTESLLVEDPGTAQPIGRLAAGTSDEIADAVSAAEQAFEVWRRTRPSKRAEVLDKAATIIKDNVQVLGALESIDTGKPFRQATGEARWAAEAFRYYAGWATKIEGRVLSPDNGVLAATLREPVGVCGAITAWNFPLILSGFKIAPALAFGNSLVVKPAEQASLSTLHLASLLRDSGMPAGLLNVVTGMGETAGQALVDSPSVSRISFTGSTAVGRIIGGRAGARLAGTSLELGGKSPNVVFADADLDAASVGAFRGLFQNAGQMCAAGARIVIERSALEPLVERLIAHADASVVGYGLDPTTTIGPLIEREAIDRVDSFVREAADAGAQIVHGGSRVETTFGGYFYEPTVIIDEARHSRAWREEVFGPVMTITPFDTVDEAIALANDTQYGLGAGVWGGSMDRVLDVGQQIRAGSVWMNGYGIVHPAVPFGGFGDSGGGRELGGQVMDFYTDTRTLWLGLRGQSI